MPRCPACNPGFVVLALLAVSPAAAQDVIVKTEGGLEVASMDGAFGFELGGRLMLDAARYDDDATDLHSGAEARRARLEMEGVLFHDWEYELGYEFADNDPEIKDVWLAYNLDEYSLVKVGQFKEPFSLEEMTSSKYITFMERALPNAFAPGRRLGVGYFRHGGNWSVDAGFFGEAVDDSGSDDDAGTGMGIRATYAPWDTGLQTLHLGGSLNIRNPGNDEKVRFRARPESHVTDIRLVNTDNLKGEKVDQVTLAGLEAAWVRGPWSLQGEYMQARVDREGAEDPTFSGWYGYASWFITGESRVYKAKQGRFKRVRPLAPGGAWELGLRLSHIDLQDGGVAGGEQTNTTFGVNWYANPQVRFMANYILVDTDPSEAEEGDVANPGGNDDPDIIQLRAQIDF